MCVCARQGLAGWWLSHNKMDLLVFTGRLGPIEADRTHFIHQRGLDAFTRGLDAFARIPFIQVTAERGAYLACLGWPGAVSPCVPSASGFSRDSLAGLANAEAADAHPDSRSLCELWGTPSTGRPRPSVFANHRG